MICASSLLNCSGLLHHQRSYQIQQSSAPCYWSDAVTGIATVTIDWKESERWISGEAGRTSAARLLSEAESLRSSTYRLLLSLVETDSVSLTTVAFAEGARTVLLLFE